MAKSVYEELRNNILSGVFEPGFPLVETMLAERYSVSRTPVREALLQLMRDGLVERSGRSTIVSSRSPEEILEIYEVRILLEGAVARWAAQRRTEFDLNRLAKAQEDMRKCPPRNMEQRTRTNSIFHEQLWLASHNATLIEMLQRAVAHIQRYPNTTLEDPGRWDKVLIEHDELLAAIIAQDADEAERIASAHMSAARHIRLQLSSASALEPLSIR